MAKDAEISAFKSSLEKCLTYHTERIANRQEWGKITFEGAEQTFKRLFELASHLSTLPYDILPDGKLDQIRPPLDEANKTLEQIDSFDIEKHPNPSAKRDELSNNLTAQTNNFFNNAHSYVPYLAYIRGDVERNISIMISHVTKAREEADKTTTYIKNKREEIDLIVSSAREASATAGVGVFTQDFLEESQKDMERASFWLKWTAYLAGSTLILSLILSIYGIYGQYATDKSWQVLSSKVLLIVILISSTVWCGKLYKAASHQATMNKHRANALKTFQAFIQASEHEPTRNAVLLETTKSIFAITPSGLIEVADHKQGESINLLELVQKFGDKG